MCSVAWVYISYLLSADDFTFAKSTGDLIPFGTSGDCYSSSTNCPQGRFSIDLRRTTFAVNSFTTWVSQGHKPTMQITKASVSIAFKVQLKNSIVYYSIFYNHRKTKKLKGNVEDTAELAVQTD